MRSGILGARSRNGPGLRREVDFLPLRFANFAKPLARQQEQLRERAEGPAGTFEGCPRAADFVVKPWENERLLATLLAAVNLRRSRVEVLELRSYADVVRGA